MAAIAATIATTAATIHHLFDEIFMSLLPFRRGRVARPRRYEGRLSED
jgi:hypothetical protein